LLIQTRRVGDKVAETDLFSSRKPVPSYFLYC